MNKENGQTLIEILIAFGLIVFIISSLTVAVISSMNNASSSKTQSLATQYAQEGLELVREMKNTNYSAFSALSGLYCVAKNCSAINKTNGDPCGKNAQCQTANIDNVFIRQATFTFNSASCVDSTEVDVVVSWSDGKCSNGSFCHNVTLISCLSNANLVPSP